MNKGGYQILDLGRNDYMANSMMYFKDCFDILRTVKKPIMVENGLYDGVPLRSQFVEFTFRDAGTTYLYEGRMEYTTALYLDIAVGYEKDTGKQYIMLS